MIALLEPRMLGPLIGNVVDIFVKIKVDITAIKETQWKACRQWKINLWSTYCKGSRNVRVVSNAYYHSEGQGFCFLAVAWNVNVFLKVNKKRRVFLKAKNTTITYYAS